MYSFMPIWTLVIILLTNKLTSSHNVCTYVGYTVCMYVRMYDKCLCIDSVGEFFIAEMIESQDKSHRTIVSEVCQHSS